MADRICDQFFVSLRKSLSNFQRVVNDSDYGRLECSATNSVGSGGPPCQYRIAQPVRLDDDDDDDDDNGGDDDDNDGFNA